MRILNIMLSRDLGGVQQVFLDYDKAFSQMGHQVINVTSFRAQINSLVHNLKLPNFGNWDLLSRLHLKIIIFFLKPQIIIAHGSRAIIFARGLSKIPLVGIAHGSVKHLHKCDYVVALTEHMKSYLLKSGFAAQKIIMIPNMIHIKKPYQTQHFHKPVVIGTIARFVDKKNIDVFLRSLAILKKQGIEFKALIGGDGEEKAALIKLCSDLNLNQQVYFSGWVKDRDQFFADIDIFCVPSKLEPFGLVVLEAFEQSTPVVATLSEGPKEIIRDNRDGLLCAIDDPQDLAQKIKFIIDNPDIAKNYAKSAHQRLTENYAGEIIANKLISFFKKIIGQ